MRKLIALIACSFVTTAAMSATNPAAVAAPSAAIPSIKPSLASKVEPVPAAAPAPAPAAAPLSEADAEAELSAKIAARLAAMRANQAARAAAAAKAKRAADLKRKQQAAAAAAAAVKPFHSDTWSYEGETGPAHWGKINKAWTKCGTGDRQSPIDIRDGMKVELEQISFDYKPSSFTVTDNGHTIQVDVAGGNYLHVLNRQFELVQFHFHRPGEERINGKSFEMVVHLVHKDAEGKQAVLAVLLERGRAQPTIQTVWNNLPLEKHDVIRPTIVLDVAELLPEKRDYFTYMGSMSTPPCDEGVLWMVMKNPVQASPAQMALFSRLYPMNARPVQASAGRVIKESN
jgi:carbonic anhydrase